MKNLIHGSRDLASRIPASWIRTLGLGLGALALVLLTGCPQSLNVEAGDVAPALTLSQWIQGGPYTLGDGNIYLVEFWATWCPHCEDAVPRMTQLQDDYAADGLVVIAVSKEKAATVQAFVDAQGAAMDYAVAIDDAGTTNKAYGVSSIPVSVLVDEAGVVAWVGHPQKAELETAIQDLTGAGR